jgi:hypothetical protein
MSFLKARRVFALSLLVFLSLGNISRAEDELVPEDASQEQVVDDVDQSVEVPSVEQADTSESPEPLVNGYGALDISKLVDASIPFLQNIGQIDSQEVSFFTDTFAGRIFVTPSGLRYAFQMADIEKPTSMVPEKASDGSIIDPLEEYAKHIFTQAVDESYVGGNQTIASGSGRTDAKVSSFIGNNEDNWQHDIPAFEQVDSGQVWPGITVSYHARGNNLEKVFTVDPHVDLNQIKVKVEGAVIAKDTEGKLIIQTPHGNASLTKPIAYQDIDGERKNIEVSYKLLPDNTYSFTLGEYDLEYSLIIDPLLAGTFIGGGGIARGVTEDASGNVFIAGYAFSSGLPATNGAYDTTFNGGVIDAYIAKFSNDLSTLLAATYIGGSGTVDGVFPDVVRFDSSGNLYLLTYATTSDFPMTIGGYDATFNGAADVAVVKMSPDLSTLLASTFLGGTGTDSGQSMIVEESGTLLISGTAGGADFPSTGGAYDTSFNGGTDLFIARLAGDLSSLSASTFLGGTGTDHNSTYGTNLKVDSSGNIYIAAGGNSSDYPTSGGAYDTTANGSYDIFISKLSNDLTTLLASTYIGGSGDDETSPFESVLIDDSGAVYAASTSNSSDFPLTGGVYDTTYAGSNEMVIVKLNSNLTSLLASTYLGGDTQEYPLGFAFDGDGNPLVYGQTNSTNYPVSTGAFLTTEPSGGVYQAMATRLSTDLTSLHASAFIDKPLGFGSISSFYLENDGNFVFSGNMAGPGAPTTHGAYSTNSAGSSWVGRFSPSLLFNDPPVVTVVSAAQNQDDKNTTAEVTLEDTDRAENTLTVEFSTNNVDFAPATLSSVTIDQDAAIISGNVITGINTDVDGDVTLHIVWASASQLVGTIDPTVYLRFRANDGYQNGSYTTSSAFSINTVGNGSGGSSGGSSGSSSSPSAPSTGNDTDLPQSPEPAVPSSQQPAPNADQEAGSVPSIPSWIPGTAAGNSGPLATPVTVADFPRIVARGKSGHDVILLQKRLNDLGFTVATRGAGSPGKETSYFGPKTQAALVRFQKAHNLPATGKLDPQTVEVLVGSS